MTPLQNIWEKRATVRSRPRRLIVEDAGYYYPVIRQPICLHPLVKQLGDAAIHYILIQSAYKFMIDIAQIETRMVNNIAEKIVNDRTPVCFSESIKMNALTVLVDESYHAYVAKDFANQMLNNTQVLPIQAVYEETGLQQSIFKCCNKLPENESTLLNIIAIAIAENSITSELIYIKTEAGDNTNKTFIEVNQDHMFDEGRHSNIFSEILSITWDSISEEEKTVVGPELTNFIWEYLNPRYQRNFNQAILESLNVSSESIDTILNDTNIDYTKKNFKEFNPIVSNIIQLIERCGLLTHQPTLSAFDNMNLL